MPRFRDLVPRKVALACGGFLVGAALSNSFAHAQHHSTPPNCTPPFIIQPDCAKPAAPLAPAVPPAAAPAAPPSAAPPGAPPSTPPAAQPQPPQAQPQPQPQPQAEPTTTAADI